MTASRTIAPAEATSSAGTAALSCRQLRKSFGDLVAVDDLSLRIADGETYGLLGPNGAGKTTAISMVAGVLEPDEGEIVVAGEPMTVRAVQTKRHIGYVPQELAVYPDLSARENLRFFARLYGMSRSEGRDRTEEVLATIGLQERAAELVGKYSGGMKRRLNIGIGLLHRPRLLILDEPTVGVDPQSRNAILQGGEALSAEGMAVLYTTHYMEEAERLCDRIGVVDLGRLIVEGTVRELTALVGESDQVHLTATGDLDAAARAVRDLPGVRQVTVRADGIEIIDADARSGLTRLLSTVTAAGAGIRSVSVDEPDLEAVFLHLTGKSLRE
ncbi:MAG TPA: ABC transporter ATP-binding protein [Actinoplanes sp.]|nr:ABC transporter ATP-binding protein [Actinoplanes sp.]